MPSKQSGMGSTPFAPVWEYSLISKISEGIKEKLKFLPPPPTIQEAKERYRRVWAGGVVTERGEPAYRTIYGYTRKKPEVYKPFDVAMEKAILPYAKGAYTEVKEKPVKTLALVGVGAVVPPLAAGAKYVVAGTKLAKVSNIGKSAMLPLCTSFNPILVFKFVSNIESR